ncbi:hypothetical protein CLOM_g14436 [Closterium sp. NIES-68]|nr:hypothetical protein CLOM_g14436 [Closterium sp. NIES-68]GJP60707.1 hypothetical protein CLOP_g17919 [Closterium sp. NIES-67]
MGEKWVTPTGRARSLKGSSSAPSRLKSLSKISLSDRRLWEQERRRLMRAGRRPGLLESEEEGEEEDGEDDSETEEEEDSDESDTWCAYCCEQPRLQSICAFFFALMLFSALLGTLFTAAGLINPVRDWLPPPAQVRPNRPPRPAQADEPRAIGVFPLLPASDPGQLQALQQQLEHQQKLIAAQRQAAPSSAPSSAVASAAERTPQQPLLQKPQQRRRGDARTAPLQQFQKLRPLAIGAQGQAQAGGAEHRAGNLETAEQTGQASGVMAQGGRAGEGDGSAQASEVMESQQQEQQAEQQVLMHEQAQVEGAAAQGGVKQVNSAEQAQAQALDEALGFRVKSLGGAGSGESGETTGAGTGAGEGGSIGGRGSVGVTVVPSSLPVIDVFSKLDPTTARTVAKLSPATITCDKAVPLAAANAPGGGQHRAARLPNCEPPPQDTPWLRPSAAAASAAAASGGGGGRGRVGPVAAARGSGGSGADSRGGVGGIGGVQHMAAGGVAQTGEVQEGRMHIPDMGMGMAEQAGPQRHEEQRQHQKQWQQQGQQREGYPYQQQQRQPQRQQQQQAGRAGHVAADREMAAPFQACVDHTKVQRMAEQSGWPYLLVQGRHPGLIQQEQALMRALWVAKAVGAVLVLPPLVTSVAAQGRVKESGMERLFSTHFFITHMYCSSGIWVVPQLPGSVWDRLPAGVTGDDVDTLLALPGGIAQRIPRGIVAASGDAEDAALAEWTDAMRQRTKKGEVRLLVYNSSDPISFTTSQQQQQEQQQQQQQQQQQRVRKNAMAALRLAPPIASVTTQLLHLLRKAYQARFGDLSRFHFAALHFSLNAGTGAETGTGTGEVGTGAEASASSASSNSTGAPFSGDLAAASLQAAREALLTLLDPSKTLLYVIMPPVPHRTAFLRELAEAYQVVTRDDLISDVSSRFPEGEVQTALEQGMAKEAAVFMGSFSSEFSRFVFQLRCFTRPLLGQSQRATVFYDLGFAVAPCHVDP